MLSQQNTFLFEAYNDWDAPQANLVLVEVSIPMEFCTSGTPVNTRFSLYKNKLYKNIEAEKP